MLLTWVRRVALVFLLLVLAGPVAPGAEIDKYLPDDTNGLVSLNVRQLIDSPLFKKSYLPFLQKELKARPELQKQFQDLGFDPFRDAERLLLAIAESCEPQGAPAQPGIFGILHGRFDSARVQATLAQIAAYAPQALRTHKGPTGSVYELTGNGRSFFFALPDRTTLVFAARREPVATTLERAAGKKKFQLVHKDVETLIAKTDNKQALWLVATSRTALEFEPGGGPAGKQPNQARKTLGASGVSEVTGGFWVTDNLKAAFGVDVQNALAAKAVSDALTVELAKAIDKGFDGVFDERRLAPVREFLKEMVIAGDGKHIVIQSEVPGRVFVNSLK
ncbi:hypothetical protein AYO44_10440 [Planctomycetaceae bacterium SCGC AG-212-F19]|nr:hypothetical protein AYO44_10440 [Planctomycetaceae bacterium SCGC AG-212-F19]